MDINRIKREDIGKGSNIKLNVCDHEVDMYWKVAIEVLETIEENNKKGEPTLMVVPYGPLGPYARLVYLVNKYRVSLKNCTVINSKCKLNTCDENLVSKLRCVISLTCTLDFKQEGTKNIKYLINNI